MRLVLFFLFVAAVLAIPTELKRFTRGFKVAKLHLYLPHTPEWEVDNVLSTDDLKQILSQPFRFLGKGAQCYAFVSQDDEYVLKLFRFDRRKKRKSLNLKKLGSLFSSCKLGYDLAREETGLVHLHLNLTRNALPILQARAPSGRMFKLPLDNYRFAIQKRASLLKDSLPAACADGTLHQKIDAWIDLLERRSQKKIGNKDPNLLRNFGFIGSRAVEIDFGNYALRPDFADEGVRKEELKRYLGPFRHWLLQHAPEYVSYFDAKNPATRG